ncbi:MAG: HNH endonuclease [Candidatus Anammoximicrobium sp.]|nr:HNH endonuclease [Candidatus Anammoximicrobium sp.]
MLSIVKEFTVREVEKAFRVLISWCVRFLIVGGGRSGSIEEAYAKAAEAVTSGRITNTKELADEMKAFVPTDAEFEAEFCTAKVSQNYLARYYLRALELRLTNNPEPEWVPNETSVINLEHILPENPNGNWPHVEPETALALYKRIGNMVLLQATKNSLIGNSPFSAKRPVLKASAYNLTAEAAKPANWGPKEIGERQARLAKLAVTTWSLSVR